MSDADVMIRSWPAAYEADVLRLVDALMNYPQIRDHWAEVAPQLAVVANEPIQVIDFVVAVPGNSADGLVAAQQLMRLSLDAAVVVTRALEQGTYPTIEFLRDVLAEDSLDLEILDQGMGSAWTKIRAFVGEHPLATAAAIAGFVGAALVVIGTLPAVVVAGAGAAVGLQIAGGVLGAIAPVLGIADAILTAAPPQQLDSVNVQKVEPGTTVTAAVATRVSRAEVTARGRVDNINGFVERIRGQFVQLSSVHVTQTSPDTARLEMNVSVDLNWAPAMALAAEFLIDVSPMVLIDG